jgi:hypothetical protein
MVPVQPTPLLDDYRWLPYNHRRGGDGHGRPLHHRCRSHNGRERCRNDRHGYRQLKAKETWTSPACVDHGTTSTSRLRPWKVKILPFRSTVSLCCVAMSSDVHGWIHDFFYAKIEQRSCHALCLSWSRLQCVAGAFAPLPWPGQVGIGGSNGEPGTAGLCRPMSTLGCREMPTLQWSCIGSFGFAQERVSRLLHDDSEELSVIR